jgi:hypothetical protein
MSYRLIEGTCNADGCFVVRHELIVEEVVPVRPAVLS